MLLALGISGYFLIGLIFGRVFYTREIKKNLVEADSQWELDRIKDKADVGGSVTILIMVWPMIMAFFVAVGVFYLPYKFVVGGADRAIAKRGKQISDRNFWMEKAKSDDVAEKEAARVWLESH